ncbi:MAG: sulfatase-like hydrolase/transferase, partial [Duncaniella sp.]|nr:sulfatase-like hydrolase/transferase [Duncaniella sp.]
MRRTLTISAAGFTLLLFASMLLLTRQYGPDHVLSVWTMSVIAVFDAVLFITPMFFLPPRLRRWMGLWFLFWPLLMWANSIYAIHFGNPIPALNYFYHGGAGSFMTSAALASMGAADWTLISAAFALAAYTLVSGSAMSQEPRFTTKARLCCGITLATTFAATTALSIRREMKWDETLNLSEWLSNHWSEWIFNTKPSRCLQSGGFANYFVTTTTNLLKPRRHIGDDERAEILRFFQDRTPANTDSAFISNRGKNLVLIVVESLNSEALVQPWSREAAPTLTGLMADPDVIRALDVVPQTGPGRSSDGQFLYNTGLLPLYSEPFSIRFAHTDYPSLAKAVRPASSIEVIGENAELYNHRATSLSYGYGRLYDRVASDGWNLKADSVILASASKLIAGLPQPFFAEITTLSMHQPYTKPDPEATVTLPAGLPDGLVAYIHALNRFDRALGKFLETLPDNTITAIASDHDERVEGLSSNRIAFFIVGTGKGMEATETRRQADLFPTLLDVMGIADYSPRHLNGVQYRGMGTGLF